MANKILITGCSSGIGKESALHFKGLGWDVIATVRKPENVSQLEQQGIKVLILDQDDHQQVEELFSHPELQDIDHAILNAGFGYVAAAEDITREAFERQLNTNVLGTWDVFHYVAKIFRKNGKGRALIISSIVGFSPIPFRGAYAASKAALEQLVQVARIENKNPNIQYSLMCPGPVKTNFKVAANSFYQQYTKDSVTDSFNQEGYKVQEKRLATKETSKKWSVSAQYCAQVAEKCFKAKKQKTRYLVCVPTFALWWVKRFVSTNLFEKIIDYTYRLE